MDTEMVSTGGTLKELNSTVDTNTSAVKKNRRSFQRRKNTNSAQDVSATGTTAATAAEQPVQNPIEADIEANTGPILIDEEALLQENSSAYRIQGPILEDPELGKSRIDMPLKHVERRSAEGLAEIHFVGEIVSAVDVCENFSNGVFIRWNVDVPETWRILSGESSGQTQVSFGGAVCGWPGAPLVLNHPIDLHYAQTGLQGWGAARLCVQAFQMDSYGTKILAGYGFTHIPLLSGRHQLEVCMWRPVGSPGVEVAAMLLGRMPALQSDKVIYDHAWQERCRLVTMSTGRLTAEIFVIERSPNPDKIGFSLIT